MKKYKLFLVLALLLAAVMLIAGLPFILFSYANITRYEVDFDACREELAFLVEFVEDYRGKADPSRLDIASGYRLYDPDVGYLAIPEEVSNAISVIEHDGFVCKDAQWDSLRFHGSRIDFEIFNGVYALVYSPEGRPQYSGQQVWVRHIKGNWYHVSFFR